MKKSDKAKTKNDLGFLQRFSLFFFQRPRKTALLFLLLAVLGILSYTTFLKREGFPKIEIPYATSGGTYLVNDVSKVDKEVAAPLSDFILKQPDVKSVTAQSFDNFYNVVIQYQMGADSKQRSSEIAEAIKQQNILPTNATNKTESVLFGYTDRGDEMVISLYSKTLGENNYEELTRKAEQASNWLNDQKLPLVGSISVINPYEEGDNPETGKHETTQRSYSRYGQREGDKSVYYPSVVIGLNGKESSDRVDLYDQVSEALSRLNNNELFAGYEAKITASDATGIRQQVGELQKTLLEGLIAVLIVGSIVIAVRASLITVLSMLTVLAITNLILYLIGYTLNTMTLFSLVLGLSLIVDDTIIMVEALDNYRRRLKNPDEIVATATRKVSRAMIAATSTAALSFAPLIFVGGIIGDFVRQIPITIIIALFVSLVTALVFIPFFARRLLLTPSQINKRQASSGASHIEHQIAEFLVRPMLWAKHSTKRLVAVCSVAIVIGLGFIFASGVMFNKVQFNIFPQSKDSNQITANITYPAGADIQKSEEITRDIETKIQKVIGPDFVYGDYYGTGGTKSSTQYIHLGDYQHRAITSQEIIKQLKTEFKDYDNAIVSFGQVDAGPPATPFIVQINTDKGQDKAEKLANDITSFLKTTKLTRSDGSVAHIENITPPNSSIYYRDNGQPFTTVSINYEDSDTTTLVTITEQAIEKEFDSNRLQQYGLEQGDLKFSSGQEEDNQNSFKTLVYAFPALMLVIYILLIIEFRSFLQPLLIFMAIPFSLLGVVLGLYFSNNPFSFFAMLGFFALIGLSIKNTILLTDYANQSRRNGQHPVDAMHEALAERFRPLIATSLTAVVSLIPLAITSPFWEGLAYVLIGGLLCSTLLVITVFPYYYLVAEFLRIKTGRGVRKLLKKN